MRTCTYCGRDVEEDIAKCPRCHGYSEELLVRLMKHPEAEVRGQAISDSVYLDWNERTVTALAEALRDPVVRVRQEAGLQLFISGAAAEPATGALIAALDDSDVKVRALAAAALSNIGPPAHEALSILARLRDASDERLRIWVAEAEARIAVRSSGAKES